MGMNQSTGPTGKGSGQQPPAPAGGGLAPVQQIPIGAGAQPTGPQMYNSPIGAVSTPGFGAPIGGPAFGGMDTREAPAGGSNMQSALGSMLQQQPQGSGYADLGGGRVAPSNLGGIPRGGSPMQPGPGAGRILGPHPGRQQGSTPGTNVPGARNIGVRGGNIFRNNG
jgi:hypothetical protein